MTRPPICLYYRKGPSRHKTMRCDTAYCFFSAFSTQINIKLLPMRLLNCKAVQVDVLTRLTLLFLLEHRSAKRFKSSSSFLCRNSLGSKRLDSVISRALIEKQL